MVSRWVVVHLAVSIWTVSRSVVVYFAVSLWTVSRWVVVYLSVSLWTVSKSLVVYLTFYLLTVSRWVVIYLVVFIWRVSRLVVVDLAVSLWTVCQCFPLFPYAELEFFWWQFRFFWKDQPNCLRVSFLLGKLLHLSFQPVECLLWRTPWFLFFVHIISFCIYLTNYDEVVVCYWLAWMG